jgi:hypothetical protein
MNVDASVPRRPLTMRSLYALTVAAAILALSSTLGVSGLLLKAMDWISLILLAWLAWFWVRVLPKVWNNRADDKVAIGFSLLVLVSLVAGIWRFAAKL